MKEAAAQEIHTINVTDKHIEFCRGCFACKYNGGHCAIDDEYKNILAKVVHNPDLPIVYNADFGHATPRCVLQYGAMAQVDMKKKRITCEIM